MKKTLILVALTAAHGFALASDWKPLTSSENHFVLVDTQSVQTEGKLQKAWFIANRETAELVPGTSNTMHMSSKFISYFSCKNKTISTGAVYFYAETDARGRSNHSSTGRSETIEVAPDSVNEAMLKFVCNKRKNKA